MRNIKLIVGFFVLAVLAAAGGCSSQADTASDPVISGQFDPVFAQILQKCGYVADAARITKEEVKWITSIDVSGQRTPEGASLTSLRGIGFFISLKVLKCEMGGLTTLDLSENTALASLKCSNNQLSSLDLSNNKLLTDLDCSINQLTSLDVDSNTALEVLDCSRNQLKILNVNGVMALRILDCSSNILTALDVGSIKGLKDLDCSANLLVSLDVCQNDSLEKLSCNLNPGQDGVSVVNAWFDNPHIPENFTRDDWRFANETVFIIYQITAP